MEEKGDDEWHNGLPHVGMGEKVIEKKMSHKLRKNAIGGRKQKKKFKDVGALSEGGCDQKGGAAIVLTNADFLIQFLVSFTIPRYKGKMTMSSVDDEMITG